ncbi:MAG: hypothetical protein HQM14_18755 [SAR324 cluster bacterium]|nr:hypothetical protein [SAR324 cluster bacterium]
MQQNALAVQQPQEMSIKIPANMQQLQYQKELLNHNWKLSEILAKSGVVPKNYLNNPHSIFAAITLGQRFGMDPMTAISSVMVVSGKPSFPAQTMLAIVQGSGLLKSGPEFDREYDKANNVIKVTCRVQRQGRTLQSKSFSLKDADRAGLLKNTGWQNYPENMMEWRSLAFVLRLEFADILAGIYSTEEMLDVSETDNFTTSSTTVSPTGDESIQDHYSNVPSQTNLPDPETITCSETQQQELKNYFDALQWSGKQIHDFLKEQGTGGNYNKLTGAEAEKVLFYLQAILDEKEDLQAEKIDDAEEFEEAMDKGR